MTESQRMGAYLLCVLLFIIVVSVAEELLKKLLGIKIYGNRWAKITYGVFKLIFASWLVRLLDWWHLILGWR